MALLPLAKRNNIDAGQLTAVTTLADGDLLYVQDIDGVGSPPPNVAITKANLQAQIQSSLVNNNTVGVAVTGMILDYLGTTAPTGYVLASGLTIGSATSGATGRANADTVNLYTLIWGSLANAQAPIEDSAGTPTIRGANAAADFTANKRLPVPDLRGRVSIGKDNMGGTAANRVTTAGSSVDGVTLGASGGAQNVTLDATQIPAHTHDVTAVEAITAASATTGVDVAIPQAPSVIASTSAGGGLSHLNVQPSIILNKIIRL